MCFLDSLSTLLSFMTTSLHVCPAFSSMYQSAFKRVLLCTLRQTRFEVMVVKVLFILIVHVVVL